jgi:hypothetical protein
VELSVDEAQAAGAADVQFSAPVPFYGESFLNFPVAKSVPVGYYDSKKGQWIPENNGRVIKILGLTSGRADIDRQTAWNAQSVCRRGRCDEVCRSRRPPGLHSLKRSNSVG